MDTRGIWHKVFLAALVAGVVLWVLASVTGGMVMLGSVPLDPDALRLVGYFLVVGSVLLGGMLSLLLVWLGLRR